jgi:spore maturation protein CgeB
VTKALKWLVCGDWSKSHQEEAIAQALVESGAAVITLKTSEILGASTLGRVQRKLQSGPSVARINRSLLTLVESGNPDVVFMRKPTLIKPKTLMKIRRMADRPILVTYNNDNPFFDGKQKTLWRNYLKNIHFADINYFYRPCDVAEALRRGVTDPRLLMPYYLASISIKGGESNLYSAEIGFVGHYEPDGRLSYIEELIRYDIQPLVVGPRWSEIARDSIALSCVREDWLDQPEYQKRVSSTKISLCFLSKLNRDVYTRRCFEIPAMGSLLLCERTRELTDIFTEDKEAVYFSSKEELVEKARYLIENEDVRRRIAEAGHLKCMNIGFSVSDRVRQLIKDVKNHALIDGGQ